MRRELRVVQQGHLPRVTALEPDVLIEKQNRIYYCLRELDTRKLDEAALKVANLYRFSPAINRDTKVPVWVSFPVTFQVIR